MTSMSSRSGKACGVCVLKYRDLSATPVISPSSTTLRESVDGSSGAAPKPSASTASISRRQSPSLIKGRAPSCTSTCGPRHALSPLVTDSLLERPPSTSVSPSFSASPASPARLSRGTVITISRTRPMRRSLSAAAKDQRHTGAPPSIRNCFGTPPRRLPEPPAVMRKDQFGASFIPAYGCMRPKIIRPADVWSIDVTVTLTRSPTWR